MKQVYKLLSTEFIRFVIVGATCTAVHYGIYCLLQLLTNINIAYTVGYILSFFLNFFLSSRFTFHTKTSLKKGIGFGLSHLVNYLLSIGLLNLFVFAGVPNVWAPLPVYAIAIPVNFLLVRTVLKSNKL